MPHFGHAPGLLLTTPSHIGQKYFAAGAGEWSCFPPQQAWSGPDASWFMGKIQISMPRARRSGKPVPGHPEPDDAKVSFVPRHSV
jgi:hypothetical protein